MKPDVVFEPKSDGYLSFKAEASDKATIKTIIEGDEGLARVYRTMNGHIADWWTVARDDFARLENNNIMPQVRAELLMTIKQKLIPVGVLDEFQVAGVFVNWWQTIKYDLKTIVSIGWNESLIPDEYLIEAFFRAEIKEIEELEAQLGEAEAELTESLEAVEYEAGEDEEVTASIIKNYLQTQISDLAASDDLTAQKEKGILEEQLQAIKAREARIKAVKDALKKKREELKTKLRWKREGIEDDEIYIKRLIAGNERETASLNEKETTGAKEGRAKKTKLAKLAKDLETLRQKLEGLAGEFAAIGGMITPEEAKGLILKKLYDLVNNELMRYLNAEKRALITVCEKLWDKYAVSAQELEQKRSIITGELNDYLTRLSYTKEKLEVALASIRNEIEAKRFKKISAFSKVRRGASPRPIDDPKYFGGDVGWIRISDVTASNKYLKRTTQYVSELGEKNSVRVDKGDLIMSICGTVGRPVIIDIPACIHDGFVQLYDIKDSDTEFLYYSLQFSEEALKAQGQSGTQTNLNTSIVSDLEIFHPSYEEQVLIAAVLSCIDRMIEQTDAIVAKQQRIKAGLMQNLLMGKISVEGLMESKHYTIPV